MNTSQSSTSSQPMDQRFGTLVLLSDLFDDQDSDSRDRLFFIAAISSISFQFTIGASRNLFGNDALALPKSLSLFPEFASYIKSLPPRLICSFFEHTFDQHAELLFPFFFMPPPFEIDQWEPFTSSLRQELQAILLSVSSHTIDKIYDRHFFPASHPKDSYLDQIALDLHNRILSICSASIARNIDAFLIAGSAFCKACTAAAERAEKIETEMGEGFLSDPLSPKCDDLPERFSHQLNTQTSRISEISPNPLTFISYAHFAKIKNIINLTPSTPTGFLNHKEALNFIHHHYRRSVSHLSYPQFLAWACLICNCATERTIFDL